jgi:hypothetical protein
MINKSFFEWLKELPKHDAFVTATALSDRPLEEAYDVELALRFILLAQSSEVEIKSVGDLGVFLTEKMTVVAQTKGYKKKAIQELFEQTFTILEEVLEDDAFKRFSKKKSRHEGGFLVSLFEVIALGVAFNIANNTLCAKSKIAERARSIWEDAEFTNWATAGVNASRRLPKLIPYGRKLFKKH